MSTIVYASDGSFAGQNAGKVAAVFARRVPDTRVIGLYVTQLIVAPIPSSIADEYEARMVKDVSQQMRHEFVDCMDRFAFRHVTGFIPNVICDIAEGEEADMVVLGSHGRDRIENMLLGHVSFQVLRRSRSPVLLVPREYDGNQFTLNKILFATDGSTTAHKAATIVGDLLEKWPNASVTVLYVSSAATKGSNRRANHRSGVDSQERALSIESRLEDEFASVRSRVQFRVEEGLPANVICELAGAEQFDLVAMGSHGFGAVDRLILGSVSNAVAHRTTVPLLIAVDPAIPTDIELARVEAPSWPLL